MVCISPPAVSDGQLLAYLDESADAETTLHLARCAACRQRAQTLARTQRRLAEHIYRVACPISVVLGEYQLALLPAEQMKQLATHIADCPHCTRELQQLHTYLTDLAPALDVDPLAVLGEHARVVVARLAHGLAGLTAASHPMPALAGVRGEQMPQYTYEAGDVQVILDIQPDAVRSDQKGIIGLVLGLEGAPSLEAQLYRESQLIATTQVDELGNFIFGALSSGVYELNLRNPTIEIQIGDLSI
jgi:hypothetical protein